MNDGKGITQQTFVGSKSPWNKLRKCKKEVMSDRKKIEMSQKCEVKE